MIAANSLANSISELTVLEWNLGMEWSDPCIRVQALLHKKYTKN